MCVSKADWVCGGYLFCPPETAHRSCSCSPGLEAGADSSGKTQLQDHIPALLQSERGAPPNSLCSPGGICDAGLRRRQTTDQAIIMTISKDREKKEKIYIEIPGKKEKPGLVPPSLLVERSTRWFFVKTAAA